MAFASRTGLCCSQGPGEPRLTSPWRATVHSVSRQQGPRPTPTTRNPRRHCQPGTGSAIPSASRTRARHNDPMAASSRRDGPVEPAPGTSDSDAAVVQLLRRRICARSGTRPASTCLPRSYQPVNARFCRVTRLRPAVVRHDIASDDRDLFSPRARSQAAGGGRGGCTRRRRAAPCARNSGTPPSRNGGS